MPDLNTVIDPHEGLVRDLREHSEQLERLLGTPSTPSTTSDGDGGLTFLRFNSMSQLWDRTEA
ncbi:hypothetical protein AB0D08_08860 [Kitasatospora sp. NPDC048540]|uniref:hypothetical protein n=1 Tax=unclassified Kitasatospora TaxID=2633591 RepID=UPI00053B2193|nr:hypothetical protein [Kitasatospora sp. MBT63]